MEPDVLIPNSINILTNPPTKVVFASKEAKESYIREEFEANTSERNWRYTCGLADVTNAILALANAQRHFAVSRGYIPSKGDANILTLPTYTKGNLA